MLGGEDLCLAVLTIDLNQNLSRCYREIIHQPAGNDRAADGGVQIAHPVVFQLGGLVGVNRIAAHRGGSGGDHVLCQHTVIGNDDLGGEQLGALRRDAADHVHGLHRTLHRGHQSRDGYINLLPRLQLTGIGVAVILLQTHFRVVRQRGDLGALGNLIAGVQRHHIHQLTGIGGGQVQTRNVLLQRIDLLLVALYLVPGLLDLCGGVGGIDGEQRSPLLHPLALLHEYIHHRTGGGQRDGLAVLGLHQTAALHHGADGAVGHHSGADLAAAAVLFGKVAHAAHCHRRNDCDGDDAANQSPPLFLVCWALFRFFCRSLRGGLCRCGSLRRRLHVLLLHDLCHINSPFYVLRTGYRPALEGFSVLFHPNGPLSANQQQNSNNFPFESIDV